MKILLTILMTVTLLVIGLLFLSSGKEVDKNVSESSIKKTQNDEYHSQYKRRDFIKERRENERKEVSRQSNARQDDARRYHEDFMVYNRMDDDRSHHDDFR